MLECDFFFGEINCYQVAIFDSRRRIALTSWYCTIIMCFLPLLDTVGREFSCLDALCFISEINYFDMMFVFSDLLLFWMGRHFTFILLVDLIFFLPARMWPFSISGFLNNGSIVTSRFGGRIIVKNKCRFCTDVDKTFKV